MANPNRTGFLARQSKTLSLDEQRSFDNRKAAEAFRDENKGGRTARITTFKMGPRNNPSTHYMVRFYIKSEG